MAFIKHNLVDHFYAQANRMEIMMIFQKGTAPHPNKIIALHTIERHADNSILRPVNSIEQNLLESQKPCNKCPFILSQV